MVDAPDAAALYRCPYASIVWKMAEEVGEHEGLARSLGRRFHLQDLRRPRRVRLLNQGMLAGRETLQHHRQTDIGGNAVVDGVYVVIVEDLAVVPVGARHPELLDDAPPVIFVGLGEGECVDASERPAVLGR